ncbi:MAG: hypothetical protein H6742_14925 [Alphaproteobacteria bacterium]|nr:hypothetical protein [Alphaproteobacteria bacterium]
MSDSRPQSGLERVWRVADRLLPPFAFSWVVEGDGALDPDRARAALDAAAASLPGLRARSSGWLTGSRWRFDGPAPAILSFDDLDAPMAGGPAATLHLEPGRLALRVQHACIDGAGARLALDAFFAALRGETLPPPADLAVRDLDVVAGLGRSAPTPPERNVRPAVAMAPGPGRTWARRRVTGRFQDLLPRVLHAVAAHARAVQPGMVRLDVPVDLRRHRPGLRSTANLTGLVRLHVHPDDRVDQLAARLAAAIDKGEQADVVHAAEGVRMVPLWLAAWAARREAAQGAARGRYTASGTVTNLGRVDLSAWSAPGFTARRSYLVPPANPDLPMLMSMVGDDDGVELVATSPGQGDVVSLLDAVVAALMDPERSPG